MKRYFSLFLMASMTLTMMGQGKYTVSGTVRKAEGKKVYLRNHTTSTVDSTVVRNGRFRFVGSVARNYNRCFLVLGKGNDRDRNNTLSFYLEPGTVTVNALTGHFSDATVNGGKTQRESNELMIPMRSTLEKLYSLNDEFYRERAAGHQERTDSIMEAMKPLGAKFSAAKEAFMKKYPNSYLTAEFISQGLGRMTYEQIQEALNNFSDDVKKSGAADEIINEYNTLTKVRPGAPAPTFRTTDVNGKPFDSSSLKGKVVLIDFWASWCVPCRKSNPLVRQLYDKYHAQGFDVIYVADNDSSPDAWKKAIGQDQLVGDGYHHVLRGLKENRAKGTYSHETDISDKYAVHFLPTKFLIDKEGKIVCRVDETNESKLDTIIGELLK